MRIACNKTHAEINGITLRRGIHNYPMIDHKDPMTAFQLDALRDVGTIGFDEVIDPEPAREAMDDPEQELVVDSEKVVDVDKRGIVQQVGIKYKGSHIIKDGKKFDPHAARAKAKGAKDVTSGPALKPIKKAGKDDD